MMSENKKTYKKKIRGRSAFIIVAIVIVIMALLSAIIVSYYRKINDKMFAERKLHIIEFTDKVTEIMEANIELSWGELNACEEMLLQQSKSIDNEDDLVETLESMNSFISADTQIAFAFDEKGFYYSSDGYSGYWTESTMLDSDILGKQHAIVDIPHIKTENFLLFIQPVNSNIVLKSGKKITHMALALTGSSMKEKLSISGFGNECYSYIINNNGRRLYQYTYENNFIQGYNVLKSVAEYPVVNGGSFETLENAVINGESTAIEFEYTDKSTGIKRNWFVANSEIQGIDWQVLLFVPTDVLGAGTDDLVSETMNFFVTISAGIIIIFILMMYVIISGHADKQIIKEKEESNILLAAAAEKAESASVAKSEFLSRMSHDIRTPINAIMGMTGIALKNIDNKERMHDCLMKIEGSSQHLLSLINDVLDMSRIESGKTSILSEPFCLGTCMANCVSIIEGQLVSRQLELVKDFGNLENVYVIGDELHLRQVFINILGNSVKFTPDGGKIYFIAEKHASNGKNTFRFILKDTGIGMDAQFIPHLFEPFTQEKGGSRTKYNGTGLGMAIVKQLVDMMGGTITVESMPKAGTTFYIEIPMEIDEKVRESSEVSKETFDLKGMKILLAEDNELNREIAKEILEEQGAIVTVAEDGKEAVELFEKAEEHLFDAILMDIMMPVMDGLVATKMIRNSAKAGAKDIPIIAMTANAYNEDREKTKEAGMNSHLSKPIDVDMLYRTLSKFYRK